VLLEGRPIHQAAPHEIVARGVAQSPEGRKIFNRLTVTENLEMGAYLRDDSAVREDMDRMFELFPRLRERRLQVAGTLSGGEQQMLAMGRALMARPRILLLDEPSMGLAPILVEQIFETVADISRQEPTILGRAECRHCPVRGASRVRAGNGEHRLDRSGRGAVRAPGCSARVPG
jgi:branched-chain amino acid transport system ATP-binding protein